MSDIIDLQVERAYRKSGIKDRSLIKHMISEGYNPCNSDDVNQYHDWMRFKDIVQTTDNEASTWTDDALSRLWDDIQTVDENENYTVTVSYDTSKDEEFIYVPDFSKFFDDEK